jgi:hypothetical protein
MHTAICTFEDRALADLAVQRLEQAGFSRHDIHLEHRHPDGSPIEDRDAYGVGTFHFFERLFGAGNNEPHSQAYGGAVERGLYVVLVEHQDEAEAARAQNVLHGMEARDVNLVHRAGQRPLRDVVADRGESDIERTFGTARSEMGATHNEDVRIEGEFPAAETQREPERAMASQGWGEQRTLEVVDDDKPIASPDIAAGREEKPR